MKKIFTLSFLLLAAASIHAQKITVLKSAGEGLGFLGLAISENGRYVCGDSEAGTGFIWDMQTNTTFYDAEKYPEASLERVSDNGVAVGYWGDDAVTFDINGTMTKLEAEQGSPLAKAKYITPDGKMVVGSIYNENYVSHGCIWTEGKKILLPEPTTEEIGFSINGTQAISASSDGKVIVGFVVDDMGTYPVIYWTRNDDGSYTLHTPCKGKFEPEYGNNPYFVMQPTGISSNGKWISLMVQQNSADYPPTKMGRMNVETEEIELGEVEEGGTIDASTEFECSAIANDGTTVGQTASRMGMMGRRGVIWKAGEKGPKPLSEVYPSITELAKYDLYTSVVPYITSDGRYILGFAVTEDASFDTFVVDTTAEPAGIESATTTAQTARTTIYGIDGKAVNTTDVKSLKKGMYIIKSGTGKDMQTKKLIVK